MSLRFRKSFGLGKLLRLNWSLSGPSLSIGPRGASISVGPRGAYANVGLPGTGLSWRGRLDRPMRHLPPEPSPPIDWQAVVKLAVIGTILILAAYSAGPVLLDSWNLGGPGARTAADVRLFAIEELDQ